MRVIDYDETLALLQAQVNKKGADYVYELVDLGPGQCFNWLPSDGPGSRVASCIVGCVIDELGFLGAIEAEENAYSSAYSLEKAGLVNFTEKARRLLTAVQAGQDYGIPWGRALSEAVELIEESVA